MQLVEQHIVKRNSPFYGELSEALWKSKNLYNATMYAVRQHYFNNKEYLPYCKVQKQFQDAHQSDYEALPRKVSQQTMRMVDRNFKSFFKALKSPKVNKARLPRYLKKDGKYLLTYTSQAVSAKELKLNNVIVPSGLNVAIPTKVMFEQLNHVRIVPRLDYIVVEVIYTTQEETLKTDNGNYAAIDLGIDNLATLTSNIDGLQPLIVSGKRLKSVNHYYNKKLSKAKSLLDRRNKGQKTSRKLRKFTLKRNNKVKDYLHKASKAVVNHLVSNRINTLIVGKNDRWKQDTKLGRRNNQNFVQIPFNVFISMLSYKCKLKGIILILQEESYTSKCSFLDGEGICKHNVYMGRRIHRGLFKTANGECVNADVNGSLNILRKCKPTAFANGVQGVVVRPRVISL